jgi:hypothetical protein
MKWQLKDRLSRRIILKNILLSDVTSNISNFIFVSFEKKIVNCK